MVPMTNLDKRPIAAYLRISKAEDESVSLDKQRATVLALITSKGWTNPIEWFIDEGVSGSKDVKRPGRDDLEERMALGEFAAVAVASIDRLARSTDDFSRILRVAETAGTHVAIVREAFDTSTPFGMAMAKIVAVLAELEARTIGSRITESNKVLREQGRRTGGKVCFGFRNIPNPAGPGYILGVHEPEAEIVREAAERVMAGESVLSVSRDFSQRGLPFKASGLTKLLRRPTLYGATPVGDDVVRRDGEPVIGEAAILDRETFDRLQEVLDGRIRQADRRTVNLPLLHGVARCSGCGGHLNALRQSTGRRSYGCKSETCQARVSIRLDELDEHVVAEALDRFGDEPVYRTMRRGGVDVEALAAVEAEIAEMAAAMTEDDADMAALAPRLAGLKARRAELRATTGPRTVKVPTGLTMRQAYAAAGTVEGRRSVLLATIRATVAKGRRGGVQVPFDPARVTVEAV